MESTDDKIKRIRELKSIEEKYANERNFKGLVEVHDEVMELVNAMGIVWDRLPKKAYCLARLGRIQEMEQTLQEFGKFSLFADQDEAYRKVALISFFADKEPHELGIMEINTIRNWLKDPKASEDVLNIVFDYEDFLGDVSVFDKSVTQVRNRTFSEKLLFTTFFSMQRDEDAQIYYNRQKNDVENYVQGYLTSMTEEDQSNANRILANKIMSSQPRDNVIEGVHFLIPQLSVGEFIRTLQREIKDDEKFTLWTNNFEEQVINDVDFEDYYLEDEDDILESIMFNDYLSRSLYESLNKWLRENPSKIEKIKSALEFVQKKIAKNWLQEINENE